MKEPLCRTCRHFELSDVAHMKMTVAMPVKRNGREWCSMFSAYVEREATVCNKYDDRRVPAIDILEKMAYIMEKKTPIGFDKPIYEFKKPEPRP